MDKLLNSDKLLFIVNLLLGLLLLSIGNQIAIFIGAVNLAVSLFILKRELKKWIKNFRKN